MVFGNGVKNIQAAAYNGARTLGVDDNYGFHNWKCWDFKRSKVYGTGQDLETLKVPGQISVHLADLLKLPCGHT